MAKITVENRDRRIVQESPSGDDATKDNFELPQSLSEKYSFRTKKIVQLCPLGFIF